MIGITETVCADIQAAVLPENGEGAGKSAGGTETQNLFVALLAALTGGLVVPQGELDAALQTAVQDTQSDLAVDGAGASGSAVPVPEGASAAPAGGYGSEGGVPSAQTAVGDVVSAAPSDEALTNIADAVVVSDEAPTPVADAVVATEETLVDVAAAPAGNEAPADVANVAAADEVPKHVADTAGNGQVPLSDPAAGRTGTAGDQIAVVSVQHADRSAELQSPPEPDANSPPEPPAQVDPSAGAEKTGPAAAQDRNATATVSASGAKTSPTGEKLVVPESGTQPAVASEAEPTPTVLATTRVAAQSGGEENASMGAGHDARPGGNELARGSGEKLFLDNLVNSHGPGASRAVNATDNAALRVADVGKAHIAEPVIEQAVRGVLLSVRDGASEMRVRMRPEHLGELHLRLVFKENVLSLDVSAQSTVVKSILESNLGQLRQSLHSNGVDVGKVSVTVEPDVSSGGHFSREAPVFQPSESEWTGDYRGHREEQQPPLEQWFRGARMRHAVNHLDLVA
jgi:flagellar hook-length control protein FliK